MKTQRLFEPDPDALERVVEILFGLLKEVPREVGEDEGSDVPAGTAATCLSSKHE